MDREEALRIAREGVRQYNEFCNRWPDPIPLDIDAKHIEWEGEGCVLRGADGHEYIDCLGGYGVFSLGHRHPAVIAAVVEQLGRLPLHSQKLVNPIVGRAAARLAELLPGELRKSFWCNSGAEAVEGALKLARLYTRRAAFVSTLGSFHGKTLGALSVTGRDVFRQPVEPLLETTFVPYGDADALADAVDERTAAVILEPVQGEGGVHVPPRGYLRAVREVCTRAGALLIADEVQTGLGRTGALFGVDHDGVVPDILCLAKALGGGVMPCGAFASTDEIWSAFHPRPLIHSSTFGHNPLAAAAAHAALGVVVEERLAENAAAVGAHLLSRLRELKDEFPRVVTDVRGLGLLAGLEIVDEPTGVEVAAAFFRHDVLVAHTLNNPRVVRIEPPLVISLELLDEAVRRFRRALSEVAR